MSSWKSRILAGSFRGVPFSLESSDGVLGRRIALHEYPLRDRPFGEDLGEKAHPFDLEFFVFGADYMTFRDRMVTALNQGGPGRLVHPYRGHLTVLVLEARGPRESTREGGMARFSATFIESSEPLYPTAVADNGEQMRLAADIAAEQIKREFAEGAAGGDIAPFTVDGPAFLAEESVSLLDQVRADLAEIQATIPKLPEALFEFAADLNGLATDLETLIRTPADLAGVLYGLVADLALLPDRPLRALAAYRMLFDVLSGAPEFTATTPSRVQQAANQAAITNLVRRAAIVEATRAVSTSGDSGAVLAAARAAEEADGASPLLAAARVAALGGNDFSGLAAADSNIFATRDQAVAMRDELADQLDAQMTGAGDPVYMALAQLRTELVAYVAATGGNLARVTTHTPAITQPALLLAHRLYGDATRAGEIVSRNRCRHPGFVQGGVAIEVLADA